MECGELAGRGLDGVAGLGEQAADVADVAADVGGAGLEQGGDGCLGQAVAVCLYELARDVKAARQPEKLPRATAGEIERITATLLDALRASGYLKTGASALAEEKARRLVRRLNLPARDAEAWLGMWRQIVWKLRRGKEP